MSFDFCFILFDIILGVGGKKNLINIVFIECYYMYNFNECDLFDYIK